MQKSLLLAVAMIAASGMMLTSCENDDALKTIEDQNAPKGKAHVRLVCSTGLQTRAALTANGATITDLYILDYEKATGKLLQVLHQTNDAEDFAEPDLTLDYGEHVLKVIATRSTTPWLIDTTNSTWNVASNVLAPVTDSQPVALTSAKTSDSFGAQKEVTVGIGTANTVAVMLDRLTARLVVKSTDMFPMDCSTWDATLQEYKTFSLQTFDVTAAVKNQRTTDVSSLAGTTGTTLTYYVLVPVDGYTTDITFTTNRKAGTSYSSITVPNVRFERNKTTTITGSFYNHKQGFSISLNDVWDENDYDINI